MMIFPLPCLFSGGYSSLQLCEIVVSWSQTTSSKSLAVYNSYENGGLSKPQKFLFLSGYWVVVEIRIGDSSVGSGPGT